MVRAIVVVVALCHARKFAKGIVLSLEHAGRLSPPQLDRGGEAGRAWADGMAGHTADQVGLMRRNILSVSLGWEGSAWKEGRTNGNDGTVVVKVQRLAVPQVAEVNRVDAVRRCRNDL